MEAKKSTVEQKSQFTDSRTINFLLHLIRMGIFIILFLPIFVQSEFIFPFVSPKTYLFRLIIELIFALYLVVAVFKKSYRPRLSLLSILLATFIGIMILASVLGLNPYRSFWSSIERGEGINTWLHLFGFFIILGGIFKTKQDWLLFFQVAIIAGWLQVVYTLGQIFDFSFALSVKDARIIGSLGNSSFLASYLIFTSFIAAYLFSQTKKNRAKLSYAALILINLFLIWKSQTRGAILGLAAGLVIFIILKLWRQKTKAAKIAIAIILIAIPLAGLILVSNKNSAWVKSSGTLSRIARISTSDISTQNRLIVWGVGYQAFLERPFLGWGWENFNGAFNQHFNPQITRDVGSQPWYDRAHNVVVEVATATGGSGLAIYLLIFIYAIKKLWQKSKTDKDSSTTNLALISFLIAYLLQNLFVFDTLSTSSLFFAILAFIGFAAGKADEEFKEKFIPDSKTKIILLSLMLILVIIPLAYFLNVRPALANYLTIQAIKQSGQNPKVMRQSFAKALAFSPANERELRFILIQHTRNAINTWGANEQTAPLIELATTAMEASIIKNPEFIQDYLILAELYLAAAKLNQQYTNRAEEIMLKALELAPKRYQVYTSLGRFYMTPGKYEDGIKYLKQAIALNDNLAEAHWNLAVGYILSHQPELAEAALDQAVAKGFNAYQEKNIDLIIQAFFDSQDIQATIDFVQKMTEKFPENEKYKKLLGELGVIYQSMTEAKN